MMTATYSPEDNKLRLYASERLPSEVYEQVKAAGFRWAPKQELFVAPMWTPQREDLLIELAGEIEDEDKGLVERAGERAARMESYSEHRAKDADHAHKAVHSIADGIPFGQPILVGHHSERHAQRDADRIENGMRRAVKCWEQSQYWKDRARGAVSAAKYKERPEVRARRIKKLEGEKRSRERTKAEAEGLIRFWEGKLFAKNPTTGERRLIEIKEENRTWLCELVNRMSSCGVQILGKDGQNYYSAWDMFRPVEERYENCPEKTVAEVQESALRIQANIIARCKRWLAHYENRLAYERAMLEADGGTIADKNKPEVGGACKCWVNRGSWCEIVKVNKVSVSVADNWGNGGGDFLRKISFDKLTAVISAADWQTLKNGGEKVGRKPGWQEREHAVAVAAAEQKKDNEPFEEMKSALQAGVKVIVAQNLFPTPPEVASRMAEAVDIQPGMRVLEPSAGTGRLFDAVNLVAPITYPMEGKSFVAIEINFALCEALRRKFAFVDVRCNDFLDCNGTLGQFDRILMNPPFDHGSDINHIKHAMNFLAPGGRLVAICANGPRQQEELKPMADQWIDLPEGTFKAQGTNVNTAMLIINKSA